VFFIGVRVLVGALFSFLSESSLLFCSVCFILLGAKTTHSYFLLSHRAFLSSSFTSLVEMLLLLYNESCVKIVLGSIFSLLVGILDNFGGVLNYILSRFGGVFNCLSCRFGLCFDSAADFLRLLLAFFGVTYESVFNYISATCCSSGFSTSK
jgi:hypothetical protein